MKNNKGFSLINIILIIIILICIGFISLIIFQGNNDNDIDVASGSNSEGIINNVRKNNSTKIENIEREELVNLVDDDTNNTTNEAIKYYYHQLNNTGKAIYDTIIRNLDALKDGYQSIEFDIKSADVGDEFQSAWDAIILDNPNLFWVDTNKIVLTTKTTTFLSSVNYSYALEPKQGDNYFLSSFTSREDVEDSINQVNNKIDEIVNTCKGTTYDKVKKVHDKLIDMLTYDQSGRANNSNIYGALIENTCICEGYAESFKTILDKLNIPCVLVYGDAVDANGSTEAHAWNEVKMDDGNWYAVDVTWDDPIILGSGSPSGVDYHKNFLKGRGDFENSHIANGDVSGNGEVFTYPTLSTSDY